MSTHAFLSSSKPCRKYRFLTTALFLVDLLGFERHGHWLFFVFDANVSSFIGAIFTLSVFLASASASNPFSCVYIKSADADLWPIEMLSSSCSSHIKRLVIYFLTTSVIFRTLYVILSLALGAQCLVSRCTITFVCFETAVRHGRARKYFSMAAG